MRLPTYDIDQKVCFLYQKGDDIIISTGTIKSIEITGNAVNYVIVCKDNTEAYIHENNVCCYNLNKLLGMVVDIVTPLLRK